MYNASNNELVRTKTLVKNAIVQIDATPFRHWYEQHYCLPLGRRTTSKKGSNKEVSQITVNPPWTPPSWSKYSFSNILLMLMEGDKRRVFGAQPLLIEYHPLTSTHFFCYRMTRKMMFLT